MANISSKQEFEYYQKVEPNYEPEFLAIKKQEDALRELYALPAYDPKRPDTEDPFHGLIELSESRIAQLQLQASQSQSENSKSEDLQLRLRRDLSVSCPNVISKENVLFLEGIMNNIPVRFHKHLCIAGGAVINRLFNYSQPCNDIDMFLVGLLDDELEDFLRSFMFSNKSIYQVTRTAYAITIKGISEPVPQLQIILRSYASPSEVVTGFDLDASGVCYHLGKYYATPRALYSLERMVLTVDIDRMSTTYNQRLIKYMRMKGFAIRIPVPITHQILNRISTYLVMIRTNPNVINSTLIGLLATEMYCAMKGIRWFPRSDYEQRQNGVEQEQKETDTRLPTSQDEVLDSNRILTSEEFKDLPKEEQDELTGARVYTTRYTYEYFLNRFYSSISVLNKIFSFDYRTYYSIQLAKIVNSYTYDYTTGQLTAYTIQCGYDRGEKYKAKLERVLELSALSVIPEKYRDVPTKVEFLTSNPGTQFSGSFNPISSTWSDWASAPKLY